MSCDRTLSNIQIDSYYRADTNYGGTYCKNQLPPIDSKFYIINMEDSTTSKIGHWVMVYNKDKKYCYYYDPFGISPPPEIRIFMKSSCKECVYSDCDYQKLDSCQCGYYCIYVINNLEKGRSMTSILKDFSDKNLDQNEELISRQDISSPHIMVGGSLIKKVIETKNNILNKIHQIPLTIRKHAKWVKRSGEPKRFTDFLNSEGTKQIDSIKLGRRKLSNTNIYNTLSLGKLNQKKRELKYDDLYHNFLIVKLQDGKSFRVEKNHILEATPVESASDRDLDIPVNKIITLREMIEKVKKQDPQYFEYDLKSKNCQQFVEAMIVDNQMDTDLTPEAKRILEPQNVKELLTSFPKPVETFVKKLTDTAAKIDHSIYGEGFDILDDLDIFRIKKNRK